MKRALVILLGALLLAVALLAGTVTFLAATEGGTRFLAGQAERFLPVRFTDVSGALLGDIRVGRLELDLEDQTLEIEELAVTVQISPLLFDNRLNVESATAKSVTVTATGARAEPAGLPPALQLPFMPLEIRVAELVVEQLKILDVFPMRVAGSAAWLSDGLVVDYLNVTSEVIAGTVQGQLGTGANPLLAAQVSWSLPDRAWGGRGNVRGRVESFEVQHTLRGYVSVEAQGTGSLANVTEPAVDLQVTVDDLVFGDTAIRDMVGRLRGTLENLTADLDARVHAPGIQPFPANVVAYGPANGPLTVRNVSANALQGTQHAQGSVAWQDGVRVLLGGSVREVSLAELRDEINGRVSAEFQFRYDDGLLGLALEGISGSLNGRSIEGAVEVAQVTDGWRFDPVRLNLGGNRLAGSARLHGSDIDVAAEVDAPALEAVGLGVSGDAAGSVRLSGSWPDLNGSADLTSSRLEGYGAILEQNRLEAALDNGVLNGMLTTAEAGRQQMTLNDVRLSADGPLTNLDWRLAWVGGEGSGALQRRDDGFEVRLTRAEIELMQNQWVLESPTRVLLLGERPGDRIEVAPACIAGGDASACVQSFVYESGRIETRGELQRAPVALFQAWLPIRLGDAGYLEGRWSLAGEPDDLEGELAIAARRLAYVPDVEAAPIDLPDLELTGTMAGGALTARMGATGEAFSVMGQARLEPLASHGVLTGNLTVAATELAPLKVFDQRIAEIGGAIRGDLNISGTAAAPRVEGQFRLQDGRLELSDPGIALAAVDVRLRLDDSGTFELTGTARQKQEEVLITAAGSGLFDGALAFDAVLKGNGLQATHPDWEVTVSPNLTLAYANSRGLLRGRVEVPQAEVRLTALPTSVPSPSEDVVVVGRESTGNGADNPIRANVEVVLGDDVTLKALGITAELEGSLRARLEAQGQATLRGTLDVTGGVLSTQGQTLTIESGSVVYNGPVTRPYIDLRAVRVIEDATPEVKVGLHIRGDANNLTSSVFSEPAMSETRALSFLVLGRDIDAQTESSDSGQLMAAAINLGLSRSKGITSGLMRRAGLDELSAMAEAQNSFAIVAGKRVTEDLYVRYTYNTLSAVGAFLVRYDLGRRWQLEGHSGEHAGMDLMYSFEK